VGSVPAIHEGERFLISRICSSVTEWTKSEGFLMYRTCLCDRNIQALERYRFGMDWIKSVQSVKSHFKSFLIFSQLSHEMDLVQPPIFRGDDFVF